MDIEKSGQQVAKRRKELALSQEELAEKAGMSRAYISLIERGEVSNLSTNILDKLAIALGISFGQLIGQPEQSDLLIPPGLREFALAEGLSVETVDKLARIPRRGNAPRTAKEWKTLYAAIKRYLK